VTNQIKKGSNQIRW